VIVFIKIDAVKATRCLEAYINVPVVQYIHPFVLHGWIVSVYSRHACSAVGHCWLSFLKTEAASAVLYLQT
jgi:hypothetical protein